MARFSATGLLKKASVSETCYTCHQQQRAEFRKRSHMPLPEGKMSCENCHNPHGSPTRPLLNADSVNDLCYSCHAEKRGPFLWEHAPVRENCLNCHEAHGSNQEALLVAARPFLCQQCHTSRTHQNRLATVSNLASGPDPNQRVIARSCQTCHAQIHGSNHPTGVRFLR
jgi:DmsE family decaheme c-type cytochrome